MKKSEKIPSFEQALDELDSLVSNMENGDLPLDKLLEAYKRGTALTKFCRDKLANAQLEIKKLEGGELIDGSDEHE